MLELSDGSGFAFQAIEQLRGGNIAEADCLDGNRALDDAVERAVDHTHAASAEFALNAVFSNFGWRSIHHATSTAARAPVGRNSLLFQRGGERNDAARCDRNALLPGAETCFLDRNSALARRQPHRRGSIAQEPPIHTDLAAIRIGFQDEGWRVHQRRYRPPFAVWPGRFRWGKRREKRYLSRRAFEIEFRGIESYVSVNVGGDFSAFWNGYVLPVHEQE